MTVTPQDHKRPATGGKHTPRTIKATDDELAQGIAYTEEDGTRLLATIGSVRGSHDRALMQAIGLDFTGLLEELTKRQGTDLAAAVVWFCRLVNDRPNVGTFDETLDEVGYEAYLSMSDPADTTEGDLPKA